MKIQIKLINGEPMGRPMNIFNKTVTYSTGIEKPCAAYDEFERTVTSHPAPGCSESDGVEAVLQWQAQNPINDAWYDCGPGYLAVDTRQIWRLSPSQKQNTMRKNILTDEIYPTDIVRVKIIKDPETGWYIGKVGAEYDCVYDYKGNFMPVEDVKAVKDGKSFTTRIIKPTDAEIIEVLPSQKVEVKEVELPIIIQSALLHEIPAISKRTGISEVWLAVWHEVEIFYGDVQKKETREELLLRLQNQYVLNFKPPPTH